MLHHEDDDNVVPMISVMILQLLDLNEFLFYNRCDGSSDGDMLHQNHCPRAFWKFSYKVMKPYLAGQVALQVH